MARIPSRSTRSSRKKVAGRRKKPVRRARGIGPAPSKAARKKPSRAARTTPAPLPKPARSAPATAPAAAWPPPEGGAVLLEPLELIRRVLMAHDMLFLSRQLVYHVAAAEGVPHAFADPDQIRLVFTMLLEHLARRAPRGGRIAIKLTPALLHSLPAVEVQLSAIDRHLEQMDTRALLGKLFEQAADPESGVSLFECREVVARQHGRLWVNLPKRDQPSFHIVLPASEEAARLRSAEHQSFKYDITIANFSMVRKRFGIRKSQSLVDQIEHYVRSLVRHPMDMVMAASDKGIITTIYETQRGTAESMASRISQRLAKEVFRIGRRPVELSFHYHLSPLRAAHGAPQRTDDTKRSH